MSNGLTSQHFFERFGPLEDQFRLRSSERTILFWTTQLEETRQIGSCSSFEVGQTVRISVGTLPKGHPSDFVIAPKLQLPHWFSCLSKKKTKQTPCWKWKIYHISGSKWDEITPASRGYNPHVTITPFITIVGAHLGGGFLWLSDSSKTQKHRAPSGDSIPWPIAPRLPQTRNTSSHGFRLLATIPPQGRVDDEGIVAYFFSFSFVKSTLEAVEE